MTVTINGRNYAARYAVPVSKYFRVDFQDMTFRETMNALKELAETGEMIITNSGEKEIIVGYTEPEAINPSRHGPGYSVMIRKGEHNG